ncbi:glutathione S-transferase family protein [Silvimonas iriomotensis]|uniref:Glutathione S-transferase n=1 Tax=Silvimonas iriomotensis TaxID=449662 RepID=A0ABQ2P9X0_9NEIS|nr:glutathione S-transferase family protein [Silvimonas iriomotensis]GGP21385.1 glutathione S-transferase [Silvimonas iriomotensis]
MPAAALKVWGRRNSLNVQKVMWIIGELELEHEHINVGGAFGGLDTPEFLARNPHGKIPVIEHDGVVVWESQAILRYLGATFGEGSLWSADPAQRAVADSWLDWSQTTLQPAFIDLFFGFYRTPEAQRDAGRIERATQQCARLYGLLDQQLAQRPYLGGDTLTLADFGAGTTVFRYLTMGAERPPLPNVEHWLERLSQSPAYREHVMMPFGDMFGKLP